MKCAIYIRVSTDKEEQKASLSNQKDLFITYLKDRNWELYELYIDVESGTKSNRKNLQRLIEDMKAKKFDIVLAKELSRLARNGALSYQLRDLAQCHSIGIITLDGAINTLENDFGKFGLFAWIYEDEAQRTSSRVKAALKSKMQRGEFKGSIAPYGYCIKDSKLHLMDDHTPEVVNRIFSDYLKGKGFDTIARDLWSEGISSPSASKDNVSRSSDVWHGSTVKLILTNPHYTGCLVQNRQTTISVTTSKRQEVKASDQIVVQDTHEAIISKETFDSVQALITSRKRIRPSANFHLFSNLLFCGDCGKGMHYRKTQKGYVCGAYDKRGKAACTSHLVKEEALKEAILKDLNDMIAQLQVEASKSTKQTRIQQHIATLTKAIDQSQKKIDKLNQNKSKMLDLLIDGIILKEDYTAKMDEIASEINVLTSTRMKNQYILDKLGNATTLSEIEKISGSKELKVLTPEILNKLIEKIEIFKDGSVRIAYRFSLPSIILSSN
ncbi:MAG: recombinase family protein [Cellulosilyticaceae bacterium]